MSPAKNNIILLATSSNVLRAVVISAFQQVVDLATCANKCTENPKCRYMGVDISTQTCTIIGSAGGPSRTFSYEQFFVIKKQEIEVRTHLDLFIVVIT